MDLNGKTIVVTGGNSGIGEAIVARAAALGANVVLDWVTNPDAAQRDQQTAEDAGSGGVIAVQADVSKVDELQRLAAAAVEKFGRIDAWVNNAGIETRTGVLDTTEEQYEKVMAVNMKSAFFGSQLAAQQMIKQGGGGVIINVSSVHEDWPMPGNTPYCVSKGGMRMLTRTAGIELGPHNIRMVNVGPGAISTPINKETEADPSKMKALDAAIPLGRMGKSEEIANAVCWLASDEASYVTCTTFFVDGGIMQGSLGL